MSGMVMRAIGLMVTAGLALMACTGSPPDPDVSPAPTGDPTPAASASPSPSAPAKPERPEAMKRKDAAGAAAAAEYFIELYPYVMATGDTEEFEAMSHRACGFCSDALAQAERIAADDWTYTGGGSDLLVTQVYARDELTGIFPLDVEISQESSRITSVSGEELYSVEAKTFDRRVELGRRDGQWVVVTVAPVPAVGR
ncbi:DUF6318 family protein [Promicromonospora sp. NPDC019610]|uniref:DUF6318 family protein n=1 Tax=Promicromonospora sp. NPDC019610 TaxID=3364405 RepID=UPI003789FCF6